MTVKRYAVQVPNGATLFDTNEKGAALARANKRIEHKLPVRVLDRHTGKDVPL